MINQWRTQVEASQDIHRQIVERYGCDPDVLDELVIETVECRDERDGCTRRCVVAYPRKKAGKGLDLMLAIYG